MQIKNADRKKVELIKIKKKKLNWMKKMQLKQIKGENANEK